jgi:lipopolysaccharide transport system permease protein
LAITAILVLVFVHVTPTPWPELSVYIYSGMTLWDLFSSAILLSATSLEIGGGYLRSSRIPAIIFPIRSVLHAVSINLFGLVGLLVWAAVFFPQSVSFHWVFFPIYYALLLFLTAPISIICSVLALKFRDFQNALALLLQALWFLSPVFMARLIFDKPGLSTFAALNPINSLCDLFRAFFMHGSWPALYDVLQPIAWGSLFWLVAWRTLQRNERSLVFDL